MDIPNAIVSIRESKNIKQVEMAQKLGIEQSNYSRFEKRGNKLTIEQLMSIAEALGVTVTDILTWGEEQPREEELRKQVADLRERNEELQLIVDLHAEASEMRKLAGKRLYKDYLALMDKMGDNAPPELEAFGFLVTLVLTITGVKDADKA